MGDYARDLNSPILPFRRDAERMREKVQTDAYVDAGIIRWRSNSMVPPADCVAMAVHVGLPVDVAACDAARAADQRVFLAGYRAAQAAQTAEQRAEQAAEARAAHGPGVTLVDVLTGRRIRT